MSQFTDVGVRPDDRTWIVVLGGGVGGVAAARHLDRALAAPDVELTLVSRDNFFLLTPLLFEACSGVLELRHCAQPIRPCLRRGRFVRGDRRGRGLVEGRLGGGRYDPRPLVYRTLGMMAAFGRTRAVAEVRGLELTGFVAWWIRRTYYLFQMPRWDTRLRIALDWTVSLLFRPDLTKVDLAPEREQEGRNAPADGSPAGRGQASRIATLLLALCLIVGLGALGRTQPSTRARDGGEVFARIDRYVTDRMRSARIPGLSLAVVEGDEIVYLKGYGRADQSGRPVTPQTPFLIGSITKSFTALAVLQLVDAGSVDLDAPVQRYLPWFRVADASASARITVRQLLTMTSGLPQDYEVQVWADTDARALERAVRHLSTKELTAPPGQGFGYSNANYETLGLIVQAVSGMSYEDYVAQRIFVPLEMRNSFLSREEAERHGVASGYQWWFGVPLPARTTYNRAELPAGYIVSSAEDMGHYLVAQMNAGRWGDVSILSAGGMALAHAEPGPRRYGYGWESVRVGGRRLVNHDGGTSSFQSSLFFDPEARVGVFVTANILNALDALSSPRESQLDGPTVRAMARTVLSLAAGRPLPSQGMGHERLTVLFDLAILLLTAALIASVVRVPRRYRSLARRGVAGWSDLARHGGLTAARNFALPIAVLYLALGVDWWNAFALFQPDLVYWLHAVAIVLLAKGAVELALLWIVFRRKWRAEPEPPAGAPREPAAARW